MIRDVYFLGYKEIGCECLRFLIDNEAKFLIKIKGVYLTIE